MRSGREGSVIKGKPKEKKRCDASKKLSDSISRKKTLTENEELLKAEKVNITEEDGKHTAKPPLPPLR